MSILCGKGVGPVLSPDVDGAFEFRDRNQDNDMALTSLGEPGLSDGWGISFIMLDGERRVTCRVGGDALEDIEQADNPGTAARMTIFDRHRPRFEAIASKLHDAGHEPRMTTKHLKSGM